MTIGVRRNETAARAPRLGLCGWRARVADAFAVVILGLAILLADRPAVAQLREQPDTIAVFISSDFDGCYVPGVIRAIRQFTQEAADQINAAGGISRRPIRLRFFDDADDAAKTVAAMESALADPSLLAMIGVPSSTRGKAVFERHGAQIRAMGVPFITEISLNQIFADQPRVFTLASSVDNEVAVLRAFIQARGFRRPAFVGLEGDLYTGALGDGLKVLDGGVSMVADHRIRIVDYKLAPGQADAAIADLKAKAPDLVVLGLGSGPGASFVEEMNDAGIDAPVFVVLGRITRLLGRTGSLEARRAYYQFGWDGVPNAYNERLRRRIWEAGEGNWIFEDRPAELPSDEWARRGCKTREPDIRTVLDDKNRRAIGRGAQYRDMLTLIADAAAGTPERAALADRRRHIAEGLSGYAPGRKMHHGWWQDWSFTPRRASAADTLIIERAPGSADIVLAPTQYVRVAGHLEPRPVVYISLDLISIARIDTNDRSFDAEFYLSFRSAAADIDIESIEFTNAYRAQSGRDKLLSWRRIHGGEASSSFPSGVRLYRVSGKFNFEPELGRYPFDTQRLSISFQPSSAARPFLIQPPNAASVTAPFTIDGWEPQDRYVGSDQDMIPTLDREVSTKRLVPFYKFNYTWVVTRNATDYYLRVVVPLGFILLVTYFSIFLGHQRFDSIIAIQVTALLSAIALYLALPKVDSDQATLSDKVFMITYALVSLMIGLSVLKDWGRVAQHAGIRRSVWLVQSLAYPAVAIGMMSYLISGPQFLTTWSARLAEALKALVS